MNAIREAAARVKGHWAKGYLSHQGNACGIGHLHIAAGVLALVPLPPEVREQQKLMGTVALEMFPDRFAPEEQSEFAWVGAPPFAEFNDHPLTTEDEVIAVMEKAAVRWDERI